MYCSFELINFVFRCVCGGGEAGARTPLNDSGSEDEGWGAEEEAGRVAGTRCVTSSELQCKTALGKGNEGGGGEDRGEESSE